jgi:hypothetical protein
LFLAGGMRNSFMKARAGVVILVLASMSAAAEQIEIRSPDHTYTYAYGTAFSHQVDRDPCTNQLIARVTLSNYPYAGDRYPRRDETFDFRFPGLKFDPRARVFLGYAGHNNWIPVAAYQSNLPYGGYELSHFAQIVLLKRSGHVTAILTASRYPRIGGKWVEVDDNLSLQNLLAMGLDYLTR